jgi:hypothetical protein
MVMNVELSLNKKIKDCEDSLTILSELQPKHKLLRFDGEGRTASELDDLVNQLVDEFGPEDCDKDCISDKDLLITFQTFEFAIQAAIAIEAARHK